MATASEPGWVEEYVAVDAEQFADFIEHEVLDLEDLAEGAEIQRRRFNRMTPPGVSWVQPMFPSVAPFDAEFFDDLFLSELLGEDKNSVAVFPLSLALDPQTRETLVYNADGLLIAVVPADPVVREWREDADPARVTLQLDLLPMEDVEPYLYTERRIAEYNEAQTAVATKAGGTALRGLGSNEFGIAGIQRMSNGNMQITVSNGMDSAEVFAYTVWHTSSVSVVVWTNEYDEVLTNSHTAWHPTAPAFDGIESEWECLTTNLALVDGVGVFEDTAIPPHARLRFYAVANPLDSDGDGLSDAVERLVHKTDPHNPDTDGDGVSDGVEVAMGSNPLDTASTPVLDELDEALAQVNTAQIGYLCYLCGLPFAYDSSASYAQRISQLREMLDALLGSFLDLEVNTGGMLVEQPVVVVWALESVLTSIGSGSGNWLQGPVTTEQVEEIVAVLEKLTRLVSIGKQQPGHKHQPIAYHDGAVQVSNSWDLGTGLPERWPTNQPIQTCLLLGIKEEIPMVGSGTVDDWILVNNSARFPAAGSIYTQHIADISTVWNPDGTNTLALWDCGDCAGTNNYAFLSPFSLIHVLDVPVLKVDLDADTDRDGDIDDDDETGEETHSLTRGTLVSPSLRALAATQNDITGLATLKINTQPTDPITGLTLKLKKTYEASGCTLHFLKTNGEKLPDIGNGQSYSLADWPTNTITLAVMPQYARPLTTSTWPIRFDLELQAVDANANVVCHDTVRLKVAPMILPPECNRPQKIYTTTIEGIPGATSMDATDAQVWAQDMVKFVKYQIADGQTGEMFVDLEHYAKGSFPDKLRSDEDWDGINVWSVDMLGDGGNIMVTPSLPDAPFGKLLIGSAKAGKPDPLTYWEGQGVQPTVRITVDWLMVGHVDEILMWVASDKVLYADPWKAADLLHQEIAAGHQTNSLWFGFDAAGTNKTIQQVVIAPSGVGFKLTTLPLLGLSNSSSPATLVFSNTIFVADDVLRVDDEILKVTSANGPTVTVARAQAARPAAAHATGSVIYAYTAVMKDNLPVDQAGVSVVEKIAIATNQLRQAMGSYSAAFVPMPVIFEYTTSEGVSGYAAKSANVVNCLLSTGGTICYSATGCTVFRNYISSVLPAAQEVFGGWEGLHCNYGEIHCATAAQRELDLAEPWWEQLDDWE